MSAQPPAPPNDLLRTPTAGQDMTKVLFPGAQYTVPVAAPPMRWYKSQKFKAYVGSWLTLVFGWLMQCLSSNTWEWKALAITTLGMAGLIVKDWMATDVIAPLAVMNRNNVLPAGQRPVA